MGRGGKGNRTMKVSAKYKYDHPDREKETSSQLAQSLSDSSTVLRSLYGT